MNDRSGATALLVPGNRITVQIPEGIAATGTLLGLDTVQGVPVLVLDAERVGGSTNADGQATIIPLAAVLLIRPAPPRHPAEM